MAHDGQEEGGLQGGLLATGRGWWDRTAPCPVAVAITANVQGTMGFQRGIREAREEQEDCRRSATC